MSSRFVTREVAVGMGQGDHEEPQPSVLEISASAQGSRPPSVGVRVGDAPCSQKGDPRLTAEVSGSYLGMNWKLFHKRFRQDFQNGFAFLSLFWLVVTSSFISLHDFLRELTSGFLSTSLD